MTNSIKPTPSDTHPEMVTITRGKLKGKRYINQEKAEQAILESQQQQVVQRLQKNVRKDLKRVTIDDYYWV